MGNIVVSGALCKCMFGVAPTPIMILPTKRVLGGVLPVGTILDFAPFLNVLPFGACTQPANLSRVCVPAITSWIPMSPTVLIGGVPVLTKNSIGICALGGVVQFVTPGQFTITA